LPWRITLNLQEQANNLPSLPGCYLMKREDGQVIYVGKAKSLKARVVSYFNNSQKNLKNELLIKHIKKFDFIVTATEAEAFVLENNLIKKYLPKYNILLKDDKSYPYLAVDFNEDFPTLKYLRRVKSGALRKTWGPFPTGSNISLVIKILIKFFKLRDCSLSEFKSKKQACLLQQLGQCSAPCVKLISAQEYEVALRGALDFFEGKSFKIIKRMEQEMLAHAKQEHFEYAATLRDDIAVLSTFVKQNYGQNSVELNLGGGVSDLDCVAFYAGELVDVVISTIRNNILVGNKSLYFSRESCFSEQDDVEDEVLTLVLQYYTEDNGGIPPKIVTNFSSEKNDLLSKALSIIDPVATTAILPSNANQLLIDATLKNAQEYQLFRKKNNTNRYEGLEVLQKLLGLAERPIILEAFDVAIWQGKSPTAAQVVFYNGVPDKKQYRHYHLEERPEGNNDFEMLKELLGRRIGHGNLPDVFVVDGGRGQLAVFVGVLSDWGLKIPCVAIAKSKVIHRGKDAGSKGEKVERSVERLYLPGRTNPYELSKNRALFSILVAMRDEAHRFSRRLHHKKERQRLFK